MKFAHFFIDRPIFAGVISIVITLVGAIALMVLPIAQYPEIAPPTIQVTANYPGANAKTVAETVATPIEQQINGVENMLYMSSQSTSDGNMTLNVTFKLGTNLDSAQVLVQNRVAIAVPTLPQDVQRIGVTTKKQSPDITMVVHLVSPDGTLDTLFTSNYALLQIRDELARLPGVGDVNVFGAREYAMRIWLDPEKISARGLTAQDVTQAIAEQNVQVAAGIVGAPPVPTNATAFQYTVTTQGRLSDVDEFENIVIKTGVNGQVTRVRDVARVELAAKDYTVASRLGGKPATAIGIFQLPGSNALETSDAVRAKMKELKARFPSGLDYQIQYDPTTSVRESIHEVQKTLFEAIALVVIVVLVFLQSWRASLIPLIAVPVSLVGTFAAMALFGFSLNNISLFGLVLAIGIVVDDAIVVVEAIEHHIANGMSPRDAARRAMDEVSGAVVAVALVLGAVFVPTAFMTGITGQFFRQFALTISISTAISALNSLTLSPALGAILLKPHGAKKDALQRLIDGLLGWFFRGFNKFFAWSSNAYGVTVGRLTRLAAIVLLFYVGLLALTGLGFKVVPSGFIPTQDRGYAASFCQLPDASSLDRTQEVINKMAKIARETPGVLDTMEIAGMNLFGGNQPNTGAVFIPFKPFSERKGADEQMPAILAKINARFRAEIPEAFTGAFPPPPVAGVGNAGGYRMYIQDRGAAGLEELQAQAFGLMMKANQAPGLGGNITTFRADVPQLWLEVDRVKAKSMNVPLGNIFGTLQTYLGSSYINDLTLFGRTYRVTAQADSQFRLTPESIKILKTRNTHDGMVPLGAVATVREINGADKVTRYNMWPAADLSGQPLPGFSTGQALASVEKLAKENLPTSFTTEWTEMALQQKLAGNSAVYIFPLCVLFVFLVLSALYESWTLPLSIILIVPMCLLSAIGGVWLRDMDNNIFTQIGFVVLVGLACKNAILIVEFAKQIQDRDGVDRFKAAVEASKLRLRPILMTSFAFILGVLPLVISSGAGYEMRQALGTAVFFGMLGVTFFGLFLTPVFYVVIMWLQERGTGKFDGETKSLPELEPEPEAQPAG
ncbi:MAG TPA: multidrug efflux RND transporter permease subunit [Chthoniobacteraceae bacterium]|nr:multidrug efflux RND transporter permease subunit [Chthoniobacteraceae bacterium]